MRGAIKFSTLSPLLLFSSFTMLLTPHLSTASSTNDFIGTSCKAASAYPDFCVLSLKAYARSVRRSPRQLAQVALSVSASRAHDASNFLSGVSAAVGGDDGGSSVLSGSSGAASSLGDCTAAMARSANRLQKSARELRRLGRYRSRRFVLRVADVQTWVSAALTDQNACLMSLSPGGGADGVGPGAAVRKEVEEASRMTSNALSFVNLIGSRN